LPLLYLRLDPCEQSASDAATLGSRVYGDPVQVVGAAGEGVRAKAGIARRASILPIDQERIATGLPSMLVFVPKLLDARQLSGRKDTDGSRYLQNGLFVLV
jgi:hypothetical protein